MCLVAAGNDKCEFVVMVVSSRHETRALHAAVRVCRRVYFEYQGQLLWKAVSPEGGRGQQDVGDLHAAFEAEVNLIFINPMPLAQGLLLFLYGRVGSFSIVPSHHVTLL